MDESRKRGRKHPRRTTRSMAKKDAEQHETSESDGEEHPDDAKKSESPAAGSSQEKMDSSPSRVGGQSPSKSPDENCSICLGELQNKSFTDSCFHTFCFTCLLEWAKVKAVCPLCKQPFKSIVHNVRSFEDYDQYHLQDERTDNQEAGARFRYRTTLTNDRWLTRQQRELERQRLLLNSHVTTRQQWSRMRQAATSHFRRQVYLQNMWVHEVAAVQGRPRRYRECSAEFFRSHPACTHRLIPWLNREMNILLHNHEDHVQFVMELIIDLVQRFDITSEEFTEHIRPFTGHNTEHFIHEFYNYARSPYDMVGYDRYAIYEEGEQPVHHILSDSSSSSSEDVVEVIDVISPSEDEDDDVMIEVSHGDHDYSSSTIIEPDVVQISSSCNDRRHDSEDIRIRTPFLSQIHGFLSSTDYLDTAHSGWESPIPGPSNIFWSSHMQTPAVGEIIVATATLPNQNPESMEGESVAHEDPPSTAPDADSDPESDLEIVAVEKPWDERSPVAISSAGEEAEPDPPASPAHTPDRFHTRLRHVSSSSSSSDDSLLHPTLRRHTSDNRNRSWHSRSWSRSPSGNDRYYSRHYGKQVSSFTVHQHDDRRYQSSRRKEISQTSRHRRRSSSTDYVSSKRVRRHSPTTVYSSKHLKEHSSVRLRHQQLGLDRNQARSYRDDSSSEEHSQRRIKGKPKSSRRQSSSPESRYQRSKKRKEKSSRYYSSSDESDHYRGRGKDRNRSTRNRSSSEESSHHRNHGKSRHKSTRARNSSDESDYRVRSRNNDRSSRRRAASPDSRTRGRRHDTSSRNRDSSLESTRVSHRSKAKKKSTRTRGSSEESSRQKSSGRSKAKSSIAGRGSEKASHSTSKRSGRSDNRSQQASSSSRSRQRRSRDRTRDKRKSGRGQSRDRRRYSSSSSSDRSRSWRRRHRDRHSRQYDSSSDSSSYDSCKSAKQMNDFMLNIRIKQERRSESVEVVRTKAPPSSTTPTTTTALTSPKMQTASASVSKKSKSKKIESSKETPGTAADKPKKKDPKDTTNKSKSKDGRHNSTSEKHKQGVQSSSERQKEVGHVASDKHKDGVRNESDKRKDGASNATDKNKDGAHSVSDKHKDGALSHDATDKHKDVNHSASEKHKDGAHKSKSKDLSKSGAMKAPHSESKAAKKDTKKKSSDSVPIESPNQHSQPKTSCTTNEKRKKHKSGTAEVVPPKVSKSKGTHKDSMKVIDIVDASPEVIGESGAVIFLTPTHRASTDDIQIIQETIAGPSVPRNGKKRKRHQTAPSDVHDVSSSSEPEVVTVVPGKQPSQTLINPDVEMGHGQWKKHHSGHKRSKKSQSEKLKPGKVLEGAEPVTDGVVDRLLIASDRGCEPSNMISLATVISSSIQVTALAAPQVLVTQTLTNRDELPFSPASPDQTTQIAKCNLILNPPPSDELVVTAKPARHGSTPLHDEISIDEYASVPAASTTNRLSNNIDEALSIVNLDKASVDMCGTPVHDELNSSEAAAVWGDTTDVTSPSVALHVQQHGEGTPVQDEPCVITESNSQIVAQVPNTDPLAACLAFPNDGKDVSIEKVSGDDRMVDDDICMINDDVDLNTSEVSIDVVNTSDVDVVDVSGASEIDVVMLDPASESNEHGVISANKLTSIEIDDDDDDDDDDGETIDVSGKCDVRKTNSSLMDGGQYSDVSDDVDDCQLVEFTHHQEQSTDNSTCCPASGTPVVNEVEADNSHNCINNHICAVDDIDASNCDQARVSAPVENVIDTEKSAISQSNDISQNNCDGLEVSPAAPENVGDVEKHINDVAACVRGLPNTDMTVSSHEEDQSESDKHEQNNEATSELTLANNLENGCGSSPGVESIREEVLDRSKDEVSVQNKTVSCESSSSAQTEQLSDQQMSGEISSGNQCPNSAALVAVNHVSSKESGSSSSGSSSSDSESSDSSSGSSSRSSTSDRADVDEERASNAFSDCKQANDITTLSDSQGNETVSVNNTELPVPIEKPVPETNCSTNSDDSDLIPAEGISISEIITGGHLPVSQRTKVTAFGMASETPSHDDSCDPPNDDSQMCNPIDSEKLTKICSVFADTLSHIERCPTSSSSSHRKSPLCHDVFLPQTTDADSMGAALDNCLSHQMDPLSDSSNDVIPPEALPGIELMPADSSPPQDLCTKFADGVPPLDPNIEPRMVDGHIVADSSPSDNQSDVTKYL